MRNIESFVTLETVQSYRMLFQMMVSVFDELRELSKKKQDGAMNSMKVKMTNRILSKVKVMLSGEPTIEFLELLDEESLPSNSDAVLIIAQFKSAMEQFMAKNTSRINGSTKWNIKD